jgi:PBP1b-binding outer membrane lipoprotein LpoB
VNRAIILAALAAFVLSGCVATGTNVDYNSGITGTKIKADRIAIDTRRK